MIQGTYQHRSQCPQHFQCCGQCSSSVRDCHYLGQHDPHLGALCGVTRNSFIIILTMKKDINSISDSSALCLIFSALKSIHYLDVFLFWLYSLNHGQYNLVLLQNLKLNCFHVKVKTEFQDFQVMTIKENTQCKVGVCIDIQSL